MLRKTTYNHCLVTDGWVSLDPADLGLIEGVYKKTLREGEERLMLAVLESAVEDFQKYFLARHPSEKKLFQQAEDWFLEKNSDELFSFGFVCETLGLHPDHIRKGLLVWKEARLKLKSVDPPSCSSPEVGEEPRHASFSQTFQDGINSPLPQLQPELTFRALSLLLIIFLAVTLSSSHWSPCGKRIVLAGRWRGVIWFYVAIASSCAVIALLAEYAQKARSIERVTHRVEAVTFSLE